MNCNVILRKNDGELLNTVVRQNLPSNALMIAKDFNV